MTPPNTGQDTEQDRPQPPPQLVGQGALLEAGLRQMVAYIASAAAGCRYCQEHTAHGAHEKGVTAEKIDRLWAYETDPAFTEAERAALALAMLQALIFPVKKKVLSPVMNGS